jgi:phage tail sheath protein FI
MVQLGAPGVYIVEASSGVRPITTVATSIAAFVDYFPQGPTNKAVQIFGTADFERIYGGLDLNSPASYAIYQFFLNGGSSAYVVRAMAGSPAAAAIDILDAGKTTDVALFKAQNEGIWGNWVRVTITPSNGDSSPFNATIVKYDSAKASAKPLVVEQFVGLSPKKTDPRFFQDTINATTQLVTVTRNGADTNVPAANGTLSADVSAITSLTGISGATVSVTIGVTGGTVGTRTLTLPTPSPTPATVTPALLRTMVETAFQTAPLATAATDKFDQAFAGVSVTLTGNQILLRTNRNVPTYNPEEVVQIATIGGGASQITWELTNVQEYWLGKSTGLGTVGNGTTGTVTVPGVDGTPPTAKELIGSRLAQSGMFALENADLFNLLCLPAIVDGTGFTTDGMVTSALSQAIAYCDERRAFFIVDIPSTINSVQGVQDWVNAHGIRDKNAAVYFPRLVTPDPLNNFRDKSVGASGTMAGLYSRTDVTRGVWKAPAGIDATLSGVTRLDVVLNDGQNGVLNPLGINCFRAFPVYGDVSWGARTLVGADVMASEWKYIPIRRLALMIEESLFRGTKWVVFEPNDEPLWAKIRQNVGAFMLQLFRQGAFQGSTPQTAFYVKCDGETTTANDRNLGVVNIEVGFAPLKPAEFVVITIRQIPDVVAA